MPPTTIHVNIPKAALICKKLGFECVPAVVGFEKGGGHSKSHPCISGVVTFKRHRDEILNEHKKMNEEMMKKK